MTDIKQLLPTNIYQGATDPLSLRGTATAGNPFATISDILIKTLTGYVSGPGVISSSDTILQAIQKLNGNITASVTGVSSVFGRSGAVTAVSGDYTTTLVPEGTNLYYTNPRVNTQIATYTGDVTLTGTVFTIGALKVLDSMINTVSWSKITGTPTTLIGYGIILTNLNVTTALGFTPYNATNPAGYISGITSGDVITALGFTPFGGINPLPVTNGGTGFSSYTIGDMLYANTTTTFAKIPFGTVGQVLKIIGGIPQWSTDIVGTGTVTSVSIVTANGISGTVANPTTTPAITLTLGAITPTSVNGNTFTTGTGTLTLSSFTLIATGNSSISGTNTGDQLYTASGDATAPSSSSNLLLTLATVNTNIGTFNNVTVNAKGLVTAAFNVAYLTGNQTITLTGEATGSGTTSIPVVLTNASVIGKVLTGYVSGAGTITSADSILSAIQKLNGNITALPVITASNGLTKIGNNIKLGGTLINTTRIDGAFNLTFGTITPLNAFEAYVRTSATDVANIALNLSGINILQTDSLGTEIIQMVGGQLTLLSSSVINISAPSIILSGPMGTILYTDGAGKISPVIIGTGLSFVGGTLSATTAGTVSSVSVVSANGFAGTVTNPTTTPAITISTTVTGLLKGNGASISAAVAGTDYQLPISLTTTGSSGASTFIANVLNIPNYTLSGLGGVSSTRLLTINGLAQDLSVDRIWTITTTGTANRVTVIGGAGLIPTIDIAVTYVGQSSITTLGTITTGVWQGTPITNAFLANSSITINTGTGLSGGGVVALGGTLTLVNTKYLTTLGLSAGVLTATLADATTVTTLISTTNITEGTNLYYTDARARNAISLTTAGSSGASTYSSLTGVLNVPNYTLVGLGGQPLSTNLTSLSGLTFASTSFVKMTAAGTFALDTNTYLTGNQNITLIGDVTGSGTTVIATTAAPTIVKTVILNTPNIIFSTPITFVTAANTATGTLVLNTQATNTVFAGPSTGVNATPTFRVLVTADMPATVALLASPTFTGIPAAPTAAPGTNTTQLATTAFVTAGIAAIPISTIAGNTLGTCITTLFVSTINSCSPLNINPTNGQNIIALATPGTAQFLIGTSTVNPTLLGILRIGQGTSTIDVGESTAGFGTVWLSQVTPSTSNYALKTSSVTGDTTLNAKTGSVVTINIADTLKWAVNTANRFTSADGKIVLDPVNASVKINGATNNDQISGYSNATATVNWLRFKADNRDSAKDALLFTSVESGTSGASTLLIASRTAQSRLNVYSDGGGVFLATNITGGGVPGIGTTGSDLIFSPSTNVIRFDTTNGQIGNSTRGIGSLYVSSSFGLIQQPSTAATFTITTGLTRDDIVGSALSIRGSADFLNLGRYFSILNLSGTTLFSVGKFGNTAIGTSVAANSTLHVGGSASFPYRLVTAATSFTATDYTIDSTTSSFTVTLPTAVGIQGRVYILKNTSGGIKTLAATGIETIDGALTKTILNGNFIRVQSTGTNWIVIG